jgi:hypothetical protein
MENWSKRKNKNIKIAGNEWSEDGIIRQRIVKHIKKIIKA